tara:strand:+ start:1850 stop:2548 length:699 start_codon:yes stop_codon:yes gene_type:complete
MEKTLTVIIPFYNEKNFIEESVNRVINENISNEIILVDDCSDDGTDQIAKRLENNFDNITYIKTKKNKGKGSALSRAQSMVSSSHVIVHDADLEYFPSDIREMFKLADLQEDKLILGTRTIGSKERTNIYKLTFYGNKLLTALFSMVNNYKVSDIATCYQLMYVSFFKNLHIKEKGFGIEVEILSKFIKSKGEIIEYPINYEARSYEDGKKIKLKDGIEIFLKIFKYRIFTK